MADASVVTVIIPNYNGLNFLKKCLRSLWRGDLIPHVIIVDNGSDDGSVQWVTKHFPLVELICFKENTGFCRAVNAGIRSAAAEFVILLNNDTVVSRHFVSGLLEAIRGDEKIFSAGAKMVAMDAPELIDDAGDFYCALGWAFARGKGRPASHYRKKTRIFAACAGAAIYRKAIIAQLGYFDEVHFAYLEDLDIGYRAQLAGYYNLFAPAATVRHVGSGASGSRYNQFKTDLTSRNSIYIIRKNMPPWQIILNFPLLLLGFTIKFIFFTRKGMGRRYLKGLFAGMTLPLDRSPQAHRTRPAPENIARYLNIQFQLYSNILRRFIG